MYLTLWYPVIYTSSCRNNYSPSQVKPQQFKRLFSEQGRTEIPLNDREIYRNLYKCQNHLTHRAHKCYLLTSMERELFSDWIKFYQSLAGIFLHVLNRKRSVLPWPFQHSCFRRSAVMGHSLLKTSRFHFPASDSLFCKRTYHQNLIQPSLSQA